MPLVFVYGTLKRGERNHHHLAAASFRGSAVTAEAAFSLLEYPSGSSPGRITPSAETGGRWRLAGEVFEVDHAGLSRLDALERVGLDYERLAIDCIGGLRPWIYLRAADSARPQLAEPRFVTIREGVAAWSEATDGDP